MCLLFFLGLYLGHVGIVGSLLGIFGCVYI